MRSQLRHVGEIRRARHEDVGGIVRVKQQLGHGRDGNPRPGEGFLLGCSAGAYAAHVDDPDVEVWVLEQRGVVRGFAVCLGDSAFRASPLWAKRALLRLDPEAAADLDGLASARLGYFDQLAVAPGFSARLGAAPLAASAFSALCEAHSVDWVVATTVVAPFQNEAAHGLLGRVGARRIGEVEEVYPAVGPITSAVFVIAAKYARAAIAGAKARST